MMQTGHDQSSSPGSWPLYRALVGVGVVCGLLIVSAFVLTFPVIARNEAAALQRAVFQVLPGAVASASFALGPDGNLRPAVEGDTALPVVHTASPCNRLICQCWVLRLLRDSTVCSANGPSATGPAKFTVSDSGSPSRRGSRQTAYSSCAAVMPPKGPTMLPQAGWV